MSSPHRFLGINQEGGVSIVTTKDNAIRTMVVRGAPTIGISAAYGLVLAARERIAEGGDWQAAWEEDYALLADSRPTAANLFWALKRMRDRLDRIKKHADPVAALEAEAIAIHESDREANVVMAQLGLERIRKHQGNGQAIQLQQATTANQLRILHGGEPPALYNAQGSTSRLAVEEVGFLAQGQ